jgi:hypothetical protein
MTGFRCVVPPLTTQSASDEVSVRRLTALIHSVHPSRGHPPGALTPLRSGSHSLPSHGRSPFRSWPLVVLFTASSFFCSSVFILFTGDLNPFWFQRMLRTHMAWEGNRFPLTSVCHWFLASSGYFLVSNIISHTAGSVASTSTFGYENEAPTETRWLCRISRRADSNYTFGFRKNATVAVFVPLCAKCLRILRDRQMTRQCPIAPTSFC